MKLPNDEIEKLIQTYQKDVDHIHRYASFDYCYNYFQSFSKREDISAIASKENLEKSVLQLATYLASWGMFRGSTALLWHSSHSLVPVIKFIASTQQEHWIIDLDNYSALRLDILESLYREIGKSIYIPLVKDDGKGKIQQATAVLVTKILLGVFGNTPAMDGYFMKGIGQTNFTNSNYLQSLGEVKRIWNELAIFYIDNQQLIDKYSIPSIAFDRGNSTTIYSKAKLIDMIFFEKGNQMKKIEKGKSKQYDTD